MYIEEQNHATDRMRLFASIFFQLETSGQLIERTLLQWKTMLRKYSRWMGNVLVTEDFETIDYNRKSVHELEMMIHRIYGSQQIRSQAAASIKRSQISRNQKEQSLVIYKMIINANLNTVDYSGLEKSCIQ